MRVRCCSSRDCWNSVPALLALDTFPYDLLGGLLLCRRIEMVISSPQKVVTFCGHSVELDLSDSRAEAKNPATAYSKETVQTPPLSEVTLTVTVDMDGTCLIEPLTDSTHPMSLEP